MLSVVIPVRNVPEATDECIARIKENSFGATEIIVVDNGSETPYYNPAAHTIYHEKNIGYWPALLSGIKEAKSNVILTMHNDVFIYEGGFNRRIMNHFAADPYLAMAGFFGSRGVGINGGRAWPEGNMLGKKYGGKQSEHGHILTTAYPSVVFDSLAMIMRRDYLYMIDYANMPMHHWTDRLLALNFVAEGFHCLTIGIGFDHGGGWTSTVTGTQNTAMEDWCKAKGLEFDTSWDYTLYEYGRKAFERKFREIVPMGNSLWVDDKWRYSAQ